MWKRGLVFAWMFVTAQGEAWNTLFERAAPWWPARAEQRAALQQQMRGETGNQSLQKHTRGSFLTRQRRGCQCRARGHSKSRAGKGVLGVDIAQGVRYGSFPL